MQLKRCICFLSSCLLYTSFMRHRARRMERRIARAVGTGSVAGAVAGASVARAGKPATNQLPKKRENTSASMGSRVGSAVGAVMDTKNKVRDSASSLKENVKDLPTQAGYAVHSAKQKGRPSVRAQLLFLRGDLPGPGCRRPCRGPAS